MTSIPPKSNSTSSGAPSHSLPAAPNGAPSPLTEPSAAQRMYEKLAREMDAVAEQFTASNGDPEMWAYYLKIERMMKMAVQMLRLEIQQQKLAASSNTSPARQQSPAIQTPSAQSAQPDTSADSQRPLPPSAKSAPSSGEKPSNLAPMTIATAVIPPGNDPGVNHPAATRSVPNGR